MFLRIYGLHESSELRGELWRGGQRGEGRASGSKPRRCNVKIITLGPPGWGRGRTSCRGNRAQTPVDSVDAGYAPLLTRELHEPSNFGMQATPFSAAPRPALKRV